MDFTVLDREAGGDVTLLITTIAACIPYDDSKDNSSSDEISAGSVLLIIILCGFFLYFMVGFIYNTQKSDAKDWTDKENCPHLRSFWCNLPRWTIAGCFVTRDKILELTTKKDEQFEKL